MFSLGMDYIIEMKTYKGKIQKLKNNQIFVFGSNNEGRHGKGSALLAYKKFGAIYGVEAGPMGQCFAIVTKDLKKKKHPSIEKYIIEFQIKTLYKYAKVKNNYEFIIAYTGSGTNLNGYSPKEMAEMFSKYSIPENIIFEEEFSKLLNINNELHNL